MNGKIKYLNHGKGFGFIHASDETEAFFHMSGLVSGLNLTNLDVDEMVEFDLIQGSRGPKAINIRKPEVIE